LKNSSADKCGSMKHKVLKQDSSSHREYSLVQARAESPGNGSRENTLL